MKKYEEDTKEIWRNTWRIIWGNMKEYGKNMKKYEEKLKKNE